MPDYPSPPWTPLPLPIQGYIVCEPRQDVVPFITQPELAKSRVEIEWACQLLQQQGMSNLHSCTVKAHCVSSWQGQELIGEPVLLLPEPEHAMAIGLLLVALLALLRERRR